MSSHGHWFLLDSFPVCSLSSNRHRHKQISPAKAGFLQHFTQTVIWILYITIISFFIWCQDLMFFLVFANVLFAGTSMKTPNHKLSALNTLSSELSRLLALYRKPSIYLNKSSEIHRDCFFRSFLMLSMQPYSPNHAFIIVNILGWFMKGHNYYKI